MAENMIFEVNNSIAKQTWDSLVGHYTQANNTQNFVGNGVRIYKTPNHDGLNQKGHGWDNYGGIKICPEVVHPGILQKGHTYIIELDINGKSCESLIAGWTNNMGWGGGGLSPSPSNVVSIGLPSAGTSGERHFIYKFTINDDVYKVCNKSYSTFVAGQTYCSYRDFVLYYGYSVTDSMGVDIILSNFRMYDITSGQKYNITATGISNAIDHAEILDGNSRIMEVGEIQASNFMEY